MSNKMEEDLFNPRFVYSEWNDALMNKRGFCADSEDELKVRVRSFNKNKYKTCIGQPTNHDYTFNTHTETPYKLFYYDPWYEVKYAAFVEGKPVEFRCYNISTDSLSDWKTAEDPRKLAWVTEYNEYRIKEDKKMDTKKEVKLYNPKFVHFEWNEQLRGKTGFFSDSINNLKLYVEKFKIGEYHICNKEPDDLRYSFTNNVADFKFFYYDPNYEIKWKYFKEGKTIQVRLDEWDAWIDVTDNYDPERFDDNLCEFRVKPEEPEVKVDVKVNIEGTKGKIHININGKDCVFNDAEEARMVLGINTVEA